MDIQIQNDPGETAAIADLHNRINAAGARLHRELNQIYAEAEQIQLGDKEAYRLDHSVRARVGLTWKEIGRRFASAGGDSRRAFIKRFDADARNRRTRRRKAKAAEVEHLKQEKQKS